MQPAHLAAVLARLLAVVSEVLGEWLVADVGGCYGPCEEHLLCPLQVTTTPCGDELLPFLDMVLHWVTSEALPILNIVVAGLVSFEHA